MYKLRTHTDTLQFVTLDAVKTYIGPAQPHRAERDRGLT
jgi:hypothetical protein